MRLKNDIKTEIIRIYLLSLVIKTQSVVFPLLLLLFISHSMNDYSKVFKGNNNYVNEARLYSLFR